MFLELLKQEVVPAIGCTEPIAVALCVARSRERLGSVPASIRVGLSKNIYKNALSVGIPNTGMIGLPIAIALGATIGQSRNQLEVLCDVCPKAVADAKLFMEKVPIDIHIVSDAPDILYIHVEMTAADGHTAEATIEGSHTHFVPTEEDTANGVGRCEQERSQTDVALKIRLRDIYEYAMSVSLDDVGWLLDGVEMNMRAAETSFTGRYGHGLGRLLHDGNREISRIFGDTLYTKILSYTCGACDARMSGAMVPVMSNSGSGNQGISCSIPVYLFGKEHGVDEERLIRALTLSNLIVIYIKQSLGRLSALCGCVVASTGSAAGITYLMGGSYMEITYAIKNMIANISGMICDGAKPGCALKVTSGVSTAILSATLAMQHSYADSTEGIVEEDIDQTIHNLTRIGREGMMQTDECILDIMLHKHKPQ